MLLDMIKSIIFMVNHKFWNFSYSYNEELHDVNSAPDIIKSIETGGALEKGTVQTVLFGIPRNVLLN